MRLLELKPTSILITYGPLDNPDKYTIDILKLYKENVYENWYKSDHKLEDTRISYESCLSSVPYSNTDRATMPPWYQCMGSLPVYFECPAGSISPFSFVDFWHTTAKSPHHNTWVYWRNPDGTTKKCHTNNISGHDKIPIEDDVIVSLILGKDRVFHDTIPGKKKDK